ncbi:four helix bundle protein [Rhodanobacter sp. B04]|uniref:four helix bundle protein n=1 Tax=Rhodanobacter sp. B04 TaxID=1945860 RepID=UPI0011159B2F|nr:four helix bundle protein [Rhodanobacter sp. B04]
MTFHLPPAVRLAETLARDIEQAVSKFSRAHRYSFGTSLSTDAWKVLTTANSAARKPEKRAELLGELVDQVDDLKQRLQLGQRLQQFSSFGQFEALMRSAIQLGKQVGGWHRDFHPKGQSVQASAPGQRAMTLSTRAASRYEANR